MKYYFHKQITSLIPAIPTLLFSFIPANVPHGSDQDGRALRTVSGIDWAGLGFHGWMEERMVGLPEQDRKWLGAG
jgi:hypothetical protein